MVLMASHPRARSLAFATALCALLLLVSAQGAAASVSGDLSSLQAAGKIDAARQKSALASYKAARSLRKKKTGAARTALSRQLNTIESLSRAKRLTGDRVLPLFTQLRANVDWFKSHGPAADGTRTRLVSGSRIYFQYFSGRGWQFHPLANFSALNAVWTDKSAAARRALGKYAHELVQWGVMRGEALVWEYYFPFGGSKAPFISSISQGTAIQALARSSYALKDAEIMAAATAGSKAFAAAAPNGLRISRDGGNHYLGYSGNRRSIIFNMFVQSLNGLHDYAEIADDAAARELYVKGLTAADAELPRSDTGAWSLYQERGGESNLNYHKVLLDFLIELCKNHGVEGPYCGLATKYTGYLTAKPRVTGVSKKVKHGRLYVRFKLSKISTVTVRTADGRSATATVGRGKRSFSVRKRRSKSVTITVRDLAGNTATYKR
jgi:hypothetical protein